MWHFRPECGEKYFIYLLEILTTHRRLYLVKISSEYLHLFSRKKIFFSKYLFCFYIRITFMVFSLSCDFFIIKNVQLSIFSSFPFIWIQSINIMIYLPTNSNYLRSIPRQIFEISSKTCKNKNIVIWPNIFWKLILSIDNPVDKFSKLYG